MKSAPESDTTRHSSVFSHSDRRQASTMTFKIRPGTAFRTAVISASTSPQHLSFTMHRFTTMSTSSAPWRTASAASNALTAEVA